MKTIIALIILSVTAAFGQSFHVIAGADLNPYCKTTANTIAREIVVLPHRSDWSYYIACSQLTWSKVESRTSHVTGGAFTSIQAKTTYINASIFSSNFKLPFGYTPQFVIAHEVGHSVLQSESEDKADEWARKNLAH